MGSSKEYRERNKEQIKEYNKEYRIKNRERISKWNEENREYYKKYLKNYRQEYPEKYTISSAKRRATKLRATPNWVDSDEMFLIQEMYSLAKTRTKETGIPWEVDHVVPLKSKLVCGLHTIWNLQIILKVENRKKHNKHII